MRSVAVGGRMGVLALAQEGFLLLFHLEHQRLEISGLVRSVAKGLVLGKATGTPSVIFSGFQLDLRGMFGGDIRFRHFFLPGL
jgi:hypothetical protein